MFSHRNTYAVIFFVARGKSAWRTILPVLLPVFFFSTPSQEAKAAAAAATDPRPHCRAALITTPSSYLSWQRVTYYHGRHNKNALNFPTSASQRTRTAFLHQGPPTTRRIHNARELSTEHACTPPCCLILKTPHCSAPVTSKIYAIINIFSLIKSTEKQRLSPRYLLLHP